ncbi:MAG: radical SAM protein [Candidatus Omnitrophica bacterium]|nr:radical SAM protein [Candidatus Omnitrophota bacterium]
MIREIIKKSMADEILNEQEIARLFRVPLFSEESACIIAAAREKSEQSSGGLAEVHAQVGLNIAPCPRNCKFCAFAAVNKVFKGKSEIAPQEAVCRTLQFEADGANAIFVMATADYPFGKFIEIGREIRRALKSDTVLIANVGDFTYEEAKQLKATGFSGIYHAVRLGEGRDTTISSQKRLDTFRHAKEAGLTLGTCLEPVGNEHSIEELVEKTIITRDAEPCYSGAARRILIPDTHLAQYGMVSEARMAHIIAVVRLALPSTIPGNCTHEPNVIGVAAGANLLWAEVGANPRDTKEETKGARGMSVLDCRKVFEEAEWKILDGPSRFYAKDPARIDSFLPS